MKKIMQTKDYTMFKPSSFNRDVVKTKALEASFREHGWIDAYPLHVCQNGGRQYVIKAGNHRFYVAQKLGIPIKYVVSNDRATIHELEGATEPWDLQDYLVSYCREGRKDYISVKKYCNETGISTAAVVSMLGGHGASSNTLSGPIFKGGKFVVKNTTHAENVKDIVLYLRRCGVSFASTLNLVRAISKLVFVPRFDIDHMKHKIKQFASFIEKKATVDQYLDMLEDLYNRQSRQKIPLKFMAIEGAKERSATNRK
jgi:hypothetical protein